MVIPVLLFLFQVGIIFLLLQTLSESIKNKMMFDVIGSVLLLTVLGTTSYYTLRLILIW